MERRNVYFSGPAYERLKALAAAHETTIADIHRRVLDDVLGITDAIRTQGDAAADEGLQATVAQLHTAMQQHIDRSETLFRQIAQNQAGLSAGLQDLQDAEHPRRVGWQQIVDTVNTLADRLDAQDEHITTSQRLMQKAAEVLTRQDQAIRALYAASKDLGCITLDTLRRLTALESGIVDPQAEEARARGDQWVARVESELLIHSSAEGSTHEHE